MRKKNSASACHYCIPLIITILVICGSAFGDPNWEFVSPMNQSRQMFGAALGEDGFIYAVGGFVWPAHITLSSVERYNPVTDDWSFVTSLNTARFGHAVINAGGVIYAIGGTNGTTVLGTMEAYDIESDSWTVSPYSLNFPRKHFGVTVGHDGRIYAISGAAADGSYLGSVEVFDPYNPTLGWQMLGYSLNEPRSGLGSGTDCLGRIYAIAGDTNPFGVGETDTIERFDPSNPSAGWVYGPSLNQKRFVGGYATADNGTIYVPGGWAGGGGPHLSSVEVLYCDSDTWQIHSNMNRSINNFAAAFDLWRRLYAIGGEHFNTQTAVERIISIPTFIDIKPDTLNLRSKAKFVTCYIEPDTTFSPEEIDPDSVAFVAVNGTMLQEPIYALLDHMVIGDYNDNGLDDLMLKFDRSQFESILYQAETLELTLTGCLTDLTPFEGTDVIQVISPGP